MIGSSNDGADGIKPPVANAPTPTAEQRQAAPEVRDLPRPHVTRSWWPLPLVWIFPLIAAAMAAYYGYTHFQDNGTRIVINFTDGSGLKANETMVSHLGVQIGKVTGIDLTPDKRRVRVNVTLVQAQGEFAKAGAIFWTVRPQISAESISGLTTVLSGPYIEALPGSGAITTEFDGLQKAPTIDGPGVYFMLHAPRLEHLSTDAPVYFRGIDVGTIKSIDLSADSSGIDVRIFVRKRFETLVQTDSKFWVVKGADIKGGILSGLQLKLGSLQEIVSGGVMFATPEEGDGVVARDGNDFPLYDDSKKEWLEWEPHIALPKEEPQGSDDAVTLPQTPEPARSLVN
jgi:paraquat-inducible protein B